MEPNFVRWQLYYNPTIGFCKLNETVRTLAISGIKQRHPAATPGEVRRMLAELMLGEDLARKVYGYAK